MQEFPRDRLADIRKALLAEIDERCPGLYESSESVALAIVSALMKGIYRGFFEGCATVVEYARESPTPVHLAYPDASPDLWRDFDLWARRFEDAE